MSAKKHTFKDGATMTTRKVNGTTIIELEYPDTDQVGPDEEDQSSRPTISRAVRMRQLIDEGHERDHIKSTLLKESYDVKTFASEWYRLNK